jgi:hypothetical protein
VSLFRASILERYANNPAGFDITRLAIVVSLISAHDHVCLRRYRISRNYLIPRGRLDAARSNFNISFQMDYRGVAIRSIFLDNAVSGKADPGTIWTTIGYCMEPRWYCVLG